MGRGFSALRKADDDVRDFVAGVRQEVVNTLDEAGSEETLECAHTTKYPLNGLDEVNVYLFAKDENIVATDTLTFKFYIRETIGVSEEYSEIYQSSNYTVVTEGVTAGQVRKFTVDDSDDIIKNATHYSVATSAGIAIPANGAGKLQVGKSLAV